MKWIGVAALLFGLGLSAVSASADTVPVGAIVYDVNIPSGGGVVGTDSFTLYNLTDGILDPTPGVEDLLGLSGQLTVDYLAPDATTVTVDTQTFSDVTDFNDDLLDLSDADVVESAILTGTLSSTTATLNGGTTPSTLLVAFTVDDPFNGGMAIGTCTDGIEPCEATIYATTAPAVTTTPEPSSLGLMAIGLAAFFFGWKRRGLRRAAI